MSELSRILETEKGQPCFTAFDYKNLYLEIVSRTVSTTKGSASETFSPQAAHDNAVKMITFIKEKDNY